MLPLAGQRHVVAAAHAVVLAVLFAALCDRGQIGPVLVGQTGRRGPGGREPGGKGPLPRLERNPLADERHPHAAFDTVAEVVSVQIGLGDASFQDQDGTAAGFAVLGACSELGADTVAGPAGQGPDHRAPALGRLLALGLRLFGRGALGCLVGRDGIDSRPGLVGDRAVARALDRVALAPGLMLGVAGRAREYGMQLAADAGWHLPIGPLVGRKVDLNGVERPAA
jgi:hypothetical protein